MFNVERVGPPARPDQADHFSTYGEQWEWAWGLPEVLRAIASPHTPSRIPQVPVVNDPMEHVLGYWFPLLYVLVHRLGWENPGAGLREWYDHGKPTDDPTLGFVAEVWGADGELDKALAWLSVSGMTFTSGASAPITEEQELSLAWRDMCNRIERQQKGLPYRFGMNVEPNDGLHLAHHVSAQEDPGTGVIYKSRDSTRRAVAVLDSASGWPAQLRNLGGNLPKIASHSWKVDVCVKPIGWIGTFRQSRETGRWFSGRHSIHMLGNS